MTGFCPRLFSLSVFVLSVLLGGCGSPQPVGPSSSLSGKATSNQVPLANVTIVAVAADGTERNALIGADGQYLIPEPPKGPLKFKFYLFPPPPPGVNMPVPPAMPLPFPKQYLTTNNPLSFDFTGPKQTYDIDLK